MSYWLNYGSLANSPLSGIHWAIVLAVPGDRAAHKGLSALSEYSGTDEEKLCGMQQVGISSVSATYHAGVREMTVCHNFCTVAVHVSLVLQSNMCTLHCRQAAYVMSLCISPVAGSMWLY